VIGDLLAAQRVMTQKTFERVRRIELEIGVAPSHYEPGDAATAAENAHAPRAASGESDPAPGDATGQEPAREEALRL
jgi:hypothetical protein